VCRIDEAYEKLFCRYFSKEEYYVKNAQVCNALQEENDIDISYRVKLGG